MEEFKTWVKGHKALAIGGGIALVVLLYLWLRSGNSAGAGNSSNAALAAYYNAEAGSTQSAAAQTVAADQLQAAENQTNVQGQVATAEIAAQRAPYQAQLDALTTLANLQAYHDYLGESSGTGTTSSNANAEIGQQVGNPNRSLIWNMITGGGSTLTDPVTGQVYFNAAGTTPEVIGATLTPIHYGGPGTQPQAPTTTTTPATPVVQPGNFSGFSAPTL